MLTSRAKESVQLHRDLRLLVNLIETRVSCFFLFRQKKVVELLEKNYRIHCSVHNKVIRKKIKIHLKNMNLMFVDRTD